VLTKKQIAIWSLVILAIVGLFIGLAILGAGSGANTSNTLTSEVNTNVDHIRGPNTAKVTLVEYSDFQCPACGQYEPILRDLASSYPNDLRIVYRHFPLTGLHPNAYPAAIASEAASKQGKFWEMHDMLFDRQSQWENATSTDAIFTEYAMNLGLKKDQFVNDLSASDTIDRVGLDSTSAAQRRTECYPNFFSSMAKKPNFAHLKNSKQPSKKLLMKQNKFIFKKIL
jgi:protein-disulfide isomerase